MGGGGLGKGGRWSLTPFKCTDLCESVRVCVYYHLNVNKPKINYWLIDALITAPHPPMEVQRKLPVRTEEAFLHIVKLVEVLCQELDASVVSLRRADSLAEVIKVTDLLGVRLWRLAVMLHDHILPHKSEGFRLPLKPDRNGSNNLQSLQLSSSHTTNRGMAPIKHSYWCCCRWHLVVSSQDIGAEAKCCAM